MVEPTLLACSDQLIGKSRKSTAPRTIGYKGVLLLAFATVPLFSQHVEFGGRVTDPQDRTVAGALVHLERGHIEIARFRSDAEGRFTFHGIDPGNYMLRAEANGFADIREVSLSTERSEDVVLQFGRLADQRQNVVITAKSPEPAIDFRNAEVSNRTLFTRDDQVLQQLNAGINAGQHEGGGKSLEIRRFGFNLDHGGVNGGSVANRRGKARRTLRLNPPIML